MRIPQAQDVDYLGQSTAANNRHSAYLAPAAATEFVGDIALCPLEIRPDSACIQPDCRQLCTGLCEGKLATQIITVALYSKATYRKGLLKTTSSDVYQPISAARAVNARSKCASTGTRVTQNSTGMKRANSDVLWLECPEPGVLNPRYFPPLPLPT